MRYVPQGNITFVWVRYLVRAHPGLVDNTSNNPLRSGERYKNFQELGEYKLVESLH